MLFRMLYDDKLAQAAYLIGCQQTKEAIIIDPQRDADRYLVAAAKEGLRLVAITETHIHADFLSGARELAEHTGAKLYLSDEGTDDWKYGWLNDKHGGGSYNHKLVYDGDVIQIGQIEIQVMYSPGHTPEHISFVVTDRGGGADKPMGIASGDFVFVGDVGRPDLLETAAGQEGAKEPSARTMFQSLQRFKTLPDFLQLWPGHGSGSACGKALGAVPQSTVGYEKLFNASILSANSESGFVDYILDGQPEPPAYFARMKRLNRDGPPLLGGLPQPTEVGALELDALQEKEINLIDTRPWTEFVAGHLAGSIHAPLNSSFPTIAGSYVEPGKTIFIVVETGRVDEVLRDLVRIGLDEVAGFISPETLAVYALNGASLETCDCRDITELAVLRKDPEIHILDVRHGHEFDAGRLPGAQNIAHTRLATRLDEVPVDKRLLVYCRSGVRSTYAVGYLKSRGLDAVQMDGGILAWQAAKGEVSK